jgi:hypothetical protein
MQGITGFFVPISMRNYGCWFLGGMDMVREQIVFGLLFFTAGLFAQGNGLEIIVEERNGELAIVSSKGSAKELVIPDTINDMPVTAIGDRAFAGRDLASVVIPDSITAIGAGAFSNNSLEKVVIGSGVTGIGRGAFSNNRLAGVTLGENVSEIGKGAFAYNRLTELAIPESVTTIGDFAFLENRLGAVEFPGGVTYIGRGAFSGNRLTAVAIGSGVREVGDGAFYNNKISTVTIPGSLSTLGKRAFDPRITGRTAGGRVNYLDENGAVLYTTANNFDAYYTGHGSKSGKYNLGKTGWELEGGG